MKCFSDLCAVLDPILRHNLQSVLSTPDRFQPAEWKLLEDSVSVHPRAFNTGKVTKERLIEVLVEPFFQLAEKVSQAYQGLSAGGHANDLAQKRMRVTMFTHWASILGRALSGSGVHRGNIIRYEVDMTPSKRAELMKALLRASFIKVRVLHAIGSEWQSVGIQDFQILLTSCHKSQ